MHHKGCSDGFPAARSKMQCVNSCMAPKAVSQRAATSAKSSIVRPCLVRSPSHAGALHAVSRQFKPSCSTRGRQNVRCQASLDAETVTNLTYAGLGLGGLSFVGTFFGECVMPVNYKAALTAAWQLWQLWPAHLVAVGPTARPASWGSH